MMKIDFAIALLLLTGGCGEKTSKPEAPKAPSTESTMAQPNPVQPPAARPAAAQVVCDRFDFKVDLKANTFTNESWYRVHVPAQKGSSAAMGWFNCTDLVGQELRVK